MTRLEPPRDVAIPSNGVVIRAGVLAKPSFSEDEEVKPRGKRKGSRSKSSRRSASSV